MLKENSKNHSKNRGYTNLPDIHLLVDGHVDMWYRQTMD